MSRGFAEIRAELGEMREMIESFETDLVMVQDASQRERASSERRPIGGLR